MGEDLLGYLLNVVDRRERERIEAALCRDPQLRLDLERLRAQLRPGIEESGPQPPVELVEQTCDLVQGYQQLQGRRSTRRCECSELGRGRCWSLLDALMCAGLMMVAAMLFLPAIANSWFRSDIQMCQHNLQQLGVALHGFSDVNEQLFPKIPVSGNRSAAGVYGPILYHAGYFDNQRLLVCPGSSLAQNLSDWRIPTLQELDEAQGAELQALRRAMGGSYGYPLGYVALRRHYPPRNERRGFYALMSDAPSLHLPERRSTNHLGRGQNVLYEDGRVEFISARVRSGVIANLSVNRDGIAEAGTDEDDSVIGGSETPPLRRVSLVQ
jgi:hypothetical protein